jgi:hypothetical protein
MFATVSSSLTWGFLSTNIKRGGNSKSAKCPVESLLLRRRRTRSSRRRTPRRTPKPRSSSQPRRSSKARSSPKSRRIPKPRSRSIPKPRAIPPGRTQSRRSAAKQCPLRIQLLDPRVIQKLPRVVASLLVQDGNRIPLLRHPNPDKRSPATHRVTGIPTQRPQAIRRPWPRTSRRP